jgi:predicted amidophosphoribosyltransferase
MASIDDLPADKLHPSKKCPECFAYIPLRAEVCPMCQARVGQVDRHGRAKRPLDWKAYLAAAVAIAAFFIYCWWAFF